MTEVMLCAVGAVVGFFGGYLYAAWRRRRWQRTDERIERALNAQRAFLCGMAGVPRANLVPIIRHPDGSTTMETEYGTIRLSNPRRLS
jgi:hypothetical protein